MPHSTQHPSSTINSRVGDAIASVVVFVIGYLIYSALNDTLY